MQDLNGTRVVITGGSQGLGLAMVEALAACGANAGTVSFELTPHKVRWEQSRITESRTSNAAAFCRPLSSGTRVAPVRLSVTIATAERRFRSNWTMLDWRRSR